MQLSLFEDDPKLVFIGKKRIRYDIPFYKKVYSTYKFDREKYGEIWLRIRKLAIKYNKPSIFFRVSPYAVLNHCYYKDYVGSRISLGDEKHIYRIAALHSIYENIYRYSLMNSFGRSDFFNIPELNIFALDQQVEIKNTWQLPIKQRIKIHIRMLRLLKKGLTASEALRRICEGVQ